MTTGNWAVGDVSSHGFVASRQWSGTDGKVPAYPFAKRLRWHTYGISHRKAKLAKRGQPVGDWNRVRLLTESTGAVTVDSDALNSTRVSFANASLTQGDAKWPTLWTAEDELKLLSKLLTKVKSSSYNMGVSLAECDKLAGTVLSNLKNLTFGVADLWNGNFTRFARRFGSSPPSYAKQRRLYAADISGRWLEMSYAVRPAIDDVFSAVEAFEALSRGPRRVTYKVSRTRSYQNTIESTWTVGSICGKARRTYTYEAYEELSFLRQVGLGNPASIVWERIPWSFVIDWFIPIGTYLELIGQIPFLKGRFLRTSSIEESWGGYSELKRVPFGSTFRSCIQPLLWTDSHWYWSRRVPLASLTVPFPKVKVHGAVHGTRILNAAALAHQVFVKYERRARERGTPTGRPVDPDYTE